MAIIALRAWYIPEYEPLSILEQRPHDLRLAKNSLLRSALRADFLDEVQAVRESQWFRRYLAGETVEFYIEGSGSYAIANIDIISHEIYFVKQEITSQFEPIVFFSHQQQQPDSSLTIYESLTKAIGELNKTWRIPLEVDQSPRTKNEPIKLKGAVMPRLKKSILFVADVSPIAFVNDEAIFSPQVCVEIGYALQVKRTDQILLVQLQDHGYFPFDLPFHQCLSVPDAKTLDKVLPSAIQQALQRFSL
jgi:hypothetical protein